MIEKCKKNKSEATGVAARWRDLAFRGESSSAATYRPDAGGNELPTLSSALTSVFISVHVVVCVPLVCGEYWSGAAPWQCSLADFSSCEDPSRLTFYLLLSPKLCSRNANEPEEVMTAFPVWLKPVCDSHSPFFFACFRGLYSPLFCEKSEINLILYGNLHKCEYNNRHAGL